MTEQLSDRTAACISSGVLKDIGLTSKEYASQVVDINKIRRARSRMRREIKITQTKEESPLSVFFGGRKDRTVLQVKEGNKSSKNRLLKSM